MPMTLGAYAFDEERSAAEERVEEIGGRDARVVRLRGVLEGFADANAAEAALDAIAELATETDANTALSLRAGRRLWVRRRAFVREVERRGAVARFDIKLEAPDPIEESDTETSTPWNITASGDTINLSAGGNAPAPLNLELTASGNVIAPTISDGTHTIAYGGTLSDGDVLVLDGETKIATLNGADLTGQIEGQFPVLEPAGTALTFTDHPLSSHTAAATVRHRDRWW